MTTPNMAAKKKNSVDSFLNKCDSASMTTTKLPKATVSNQAAWRQDFMDAGAWE